MANFTNFPAALAAELQTGFLEREFEEGLDSILGYRREALVETVPARIGETITRTRTGRLAPVTTNLLPANNTQLDNGLSIGDANLEQYALTMLQYGHATDINLMDDMAAIANNLERASRNNGVQAAQSLERIGRANMFSAYLGGNSRVRTDLAASTTTTCRVDDIRGFLTVLVNGVPTPVSGGNTLTVYETAVGGSGVTQTLTVSAAVADATNKSTTPDGVSGTITFAAATAPVNGDALVAANAAQILRPYGRSTVAGLTGGDVLTLSILQDATTLLKNNAVPPTADGTYHVILDNTSLRQLFADQDFKVLYAGRNQSAEFQSSDIVSLLDMTFIPTTEAYIQHPTAGYNGAVYADGNSGATGTAALAVNVRRPIVVGAELMIQGDFEGMEHWLDRENVNAINEVFLVDSVAHIVRPPLDRLGQFCSLAWNWIGGFACPTDITANNSIITTASNALYKRAVCVEHSG